MAMETKKKERGVTVYVKEELKPHLVYASEDGRILMAEIIRNQKKCLTVNLYVPNTAQEKIYAKLHTELVNKEYEEYCFVGDFNAVFDCRMDCKRNRTRRRVWYFQNCS